MATEAKAAKKLAYKGWKFAQPTIRWAGDFLPTDELVALANGEKPEIDVAKFPKAADLTQVSAARIIDELIEIEFALIEKV